MTYNLSYSQIAEQVYNIGILVYTDVAADHNNSFTVYIINVIVIILTWESLRSLPSHPGPPNPGARQ